MYKLIYTKQAQKDAKKLQLSQLQTAAKDLLSLIEKNPYEDPPPYKYLVGDLKGAMSRRINIQHRLVYQVLEQEKIVKVIRLWSHYE